MKRFKFVERCIFCDKSICLSVYCHRLYTRALYKDCSKLVIMNTFIKMDSIYSKSQIEEYII